MTEFVLQANVGVLQDDDASLSNIIKGVKSALVIHVTAKDATTTSDMTALSDSISAKVKFSATTNPHHHQDKPQDCSRALA